MQLGDRVEYIGGVLKGEKATIIESPYGVWRRKGRYAVEVCIRFDRQGAHCGSEQGFAILNDIWEDVEHLKVIE